MAKVEDLAKFASTARFTAGAPRSIKASPDGRYVYFLRPDTESLVQQLYAFDTRTGEESRWLTVDDLLGDDQVELSDEERARRERMRLSAKGIASYIPSHDGTKLLIPLSGRLFLVDVDTRQSRELVSAYGYAIDPKFSPDDRYVSCVRGGEVYVYDLQSDTEWQVTSGPEDEEISRGLAEFVAQEEMGRLTGYWWSPDSAWIAFEQADTRNVEKLHIADPMRPEQPPAARAYPRAGTANAVVKLGVTDLYGTDVVWVNWDAQRYPYLAGVKWSRYAPLTLVVQNRSQQEEVLLAADHRSGATRQLLKESDDTWINIDTGMPRWLPDGSGFLWSTERNGRWQLERRDAQGNHINDVTSASFGYDGFLAFDDPATPTACFVKGGDDPTQQHVYRVTLDGKEIEPLTSAPGIHDVKWSRNGTCYVHTAALLDGRKIMDVCRPDGTVIGALTSHAPKPPFQADLEIQTVKGLPGRADIRAAVIRPRDFDPTRKYPVIVWVYGGPRHRVVRAEPHGYFRQQWFADHGFVVVSMDGRGTPGRGRAWERAIHRKPAEVPLADQVAALKGLARANPEMDLERVGIFGWSYGGYMATMAALLEPDVFHAAVAGAPVTDWRDYDTHYTERYLGLPSEQKDVYDKASAVVQADRLTRPLLLIHGTADDNVYFKHSLQLSDALFRHGRDHELLALGNFTHMVNEAETTVRLYTRIVDFFREHLQQ